MRGKFLMTTGLYKGGGDLVPPHNTLRGLTEAVLLVFKIILPARKICGDFNYAIEENL